MTRRPKPGLAFFDEVESFLNERDSTKASLEFTPPTAIKKTNRITSEGKPASEWIKYLQMSKEERSDPAIISNKSIFDVFKVPEPAPKRSDQAFDLEAFQSFNDILEMHIKDEKRKSLKKIRQQKMPIEEQLEVEHWLHQEEPKVAVNLPKLMSICKDSFKRENKSNSSRPSKDYLLREIKEQGKVSKRVLGWTVHQYSYACTLIHELAELSFTTHRALSVVIIWDKMKEIGHFKKKTIDACLRSSGSFSGGVLSRNRTTLEAISTHKSLLDILEANDMEQDRNVTEHDNKEIHEATVPEQIASVNDLLYAPTHNSTVVQIKRLISLGDAHGALALIDNNMKGAENILRAYPQVFSLLLELGDVDSAFLLLERMKKNHNIVPVEPEVFVHLLTTLAERGHFCHESNDLGTAATLGYDPASGPALFHQLAQEMSDFVDSISSASAKRLQRAIQNCFRGSQASRPSNNSQAGVLVAPLKPLAGTLPGNRLVADRVSVDPLRGYCNYTAVKLRLIALNREQKLMMKRSLIDLVKSTNPGQKAQMRHIEAMESFWKWLDNRIGNPFSVIVDGANLAYYMQNFEKGKFNIQQIKFVVTKLLEKGENPLVVLPSKYTQRHFTVTLGASVTTQTLSQSDCAVLEELAKSERLYSVPAGCLDDYFWILASVSNQSSCNGTEAHLKRPLEDRNMTANRPVVLTNDQIRDHREFDLLEPKLLNRWYSSTIVNYNFSGFVDDVCIDEEFAFTPVDMFSREIQGNQTAAGTIWHFPVHDWETSDWFCVRLPDRTNT